MKRVRDWSPTTIIGAGIVAGIITAWQAPSRETLPPLILAAKLGAFTPGLLIGIGGAFIMNRPRFIADAKLLGAGIMRFLAGPGAIWIAALMALGGLLCVHVYNPRAGLLWNIINDRIFLTTECAVPPPDLVPLPGPDDWISEGNHSGWWQRDTPSPDYSCGVQAVAAHLRQADQSTTHSVR